MGAAVVGFVEVSVAVVEVVVDAAAAVVAAVEFAFAAVRVAEVDLAVADGEAAALTVRVAHEKACANGISGSENGTTDRWIPYSMTMG